MRAAQLSEYVPVATAKPRQTMEEKLDAKVLHKRQEEAARRSRIFDAKRRTIGIDKATLDMQVEEKEQRQLLERERDQHFDHQAMYFNNVIKMQELEARRRRTGLEEQTKAYSKTHISAADRREADIEHPPVMPAARSAEAEPCGVASAQVFCGEDMGKLARVKIQQRQQRDWYEQQCFEKEMRNAAEQDGQTMFTEMNDASASLRKEMEEGEKHTRKDLEMSRQLYNQSMASGNANQRAEQFGFDEQARADEQDFMKSSHLLNEDTPFFGFGGKILKADFKGQLSPDALDDMINLRESQVIENMHKKASEKREEQNYARHAEGIRQNLIAGQRDNQRTRRQMMQQMVRENQAVAAVKKSKEVMQKTVMHTNQCADEFWTQFGTHTR